MRFAFFHAIVALWVYWRFLLPMAVSRRAKRAMLAVLLLVAAFPAVTAAFFGGLISPELPARILKLGNGCVFAMNVLAGLTALREVAVFVSVLAGRSGERAHRFIQQDRRILIGMGAAAAATAAFGIHNGTCVPAVKEHDLPMADLPPALEGLTVVQLSDLHASALFRRDHMEALVARVNALKPDLIVITGDLVDGEVSARLQDVAPYRFLRAPLGVWACEGNHEHYVDYPGWMAEFQKLGIRVLRNECVTLNIKGAPLTLAGVTDPWAKRFPGRALPDPVAAFAGAPEKGPRILLSHQPKPALKYDAAVRFDVMLSGHTHGGQVFGLDRAVAVLNATFVRGWYQLGRAKLFVHSGSGLWNGFPVRLGAPSEIVRFTLKRACAAQ